MKPVTVYTKPGCPYCSRAMSLLAKKEADVTEIVASRDPEKKAEMVQRSGGKSTYPQVFIGESHVGGCDDVMALERRGELDAMLAG